MTKTSNENTIYEVIVVYDSNDCINCSKEYYNILDKVDSMRSVGRLNISVVISAYDKYNLKNFLNSIINSGELPDNIEISSKKYEALLKSDKYRSFVILHMGTKTRIAALKEHSLLWKHLE